MTQVSVFLVWIAGIFTGVGLANGDVLPTLTALVLLFIMRIVEKKNQKK